MSKLLVVDDEQSICWGLTRLGESLGHEVVAASSAEQAFDEAERQRPDVVILDVRLPGMDGLTAIERFQRQLGSVPIIVITAYGDLRTAVEAVRRGAFDYIAKPFDVDKVKGALVRALVEPARRRRSARRRRRAWKAWSAARPRCRKSTSGSRWRPRPTPRCCSAARAAPARSWPPGRSTATAAAPSGPFVAVNVAALSPSLAESELFGHVRGAFTGAEEDRVGLLVQANGGTLFLDEVADIPLPTQVKLLRALEHDEVVPVGGNHALRDRFSRHLGHASEFDRSARRRARFATTCCSGSARFRSNCRRCAIGRKTSATWRATSSAGWPADRANRRRD